MRSWTLATFAAEPLTVFEGVGYDLLVERPRWMGHAACQYVDAEAFFPEGGAQATAAKAICASCPVESECLAEALADESLDGCGAARRRRNAGRGAGRPRR